MNTIEKQETLTRIARHLMLHGSFTDNLGLLNGKMGIVIFFYQYARFTGNSLYEDFAGEVLDEIFEEIHVNIPVDFQDGLCGIGWGIAYLIQNGFVEADPDEVLEEIDQRILERDVRRIKDLSLETGLMGIAQYVITRTNWDKAYLTDLLNNLESQNIKKEIHTHVIKQLHQRINKGKGPIESVAFLKERVLLSEWESETLFEQSRSLGIKDNGFTGIGLYLLWEGK